MASVDEQGGDEDARKATKDITKRAPRYNDKSFAELSINELEGAVRELNTLKRQSNKKDEDLTHMNDVREEKKKLASQVKTLEKELESKQAEIDRLKRTSRKDDDFNQHAAGIKTACMKTLKCQMDYQAAFKEQLSSGGGRAVSVIQGNVSPDVLKPLGLVPGQQTKYTDKFFGERVTRSCGGVMLALARNLTVKWVKATAELRIDGTYIIVDQEAEKRRAEAEKRKAVKRKQAGKGTAQTGGDATEADPELEEEVDGQDAHDSDGSENAGTGSKKRRRSEEGGDAVEDDPEEGVESQAECREQLQAGGDDGEDVS